MHGRDETYKQDFGRKTWRKVTTWKTRAYMGIISEWILGK